MPRSRRFVQVDVFSRTPLCGNPLAVVLDAQGLETPTLQAIAREMNLSETTFVLPPPEPTADAQVRIFTPAVELPFAGHPVVGTAWVLVDEGLVGVGGPDAGPVPVRLALGVGTLPVAVERLPGGALGRVTMTQKRPEFLETFGPAESADIAGALGLAPGDLAGATPPQVVSTGLPMLIVPLASLAAVQAIRLDLERLARVLRRAGPAGQVQSLYVFTRETVAPDAHVHTRLFAPGAGVLEDPATGSASGALGAYLVRAGLCGVGQARVRIENEQGLEMGRPSRITIEVDRGAPGGEITAVRVGGEVVKVIEGTIRI